MSFDELPPLSTAEPGRIAEALVEEIGKQWREKREAAIAAGAAGLDVEVSSRVLVDHHTGWNLKDELLRRLDRLTPIERTRWSVLRQELTPDRELVTLRLVAEGVDLGPQGGQP